MSLWKKRFWSIFLLSGFTTLASCSKPEQINENLSSKKEQSYIWPKVAYPLDHDQDIEKKIAATLKHMTIEQKVAQMIQPEIRDFSVEDMRLYGFGSYLNGGGAYPKNNKSASPQDWLNLAEKMYQASIDASLDGSTIPTMWGTDAVHGHNNLRGATLFPHNIGLGAMRNPELMREIANITAIEVLTTGIDWIFAPTVATARDDRWGRSYESYSENPLLVGEYTRAIVEGLQQGKQIEKSQVGRVTSDGVISTVKHFIGDGGTEKGDDQGNNPVDEQELAEIHGQGYFSGLAAGALTVMASFNSWKGEKVHGSYYLLTQVLKEQMGFKGFVVGDWNGHGQIPGCKNESCPQAINAGLDMFMVPGKEWKQLYHNTIEQVKSGEIQQSRIDDAVTRILRVKYLSGLFSRASPEQREYSARIDLVGKQAHRQLARQAVRESLVLLKNNDRILPLNPAQTFLIAGDGANDIAKQSGGWSVTWQGTQNENTDFPGSTSILEGLRQQVDTAGGNVEFSETGDFTEKPDVAIVVFGENPYAEGHGDRETLEFERGHKSSLKMLKKLKENNIPVVSVFLSGRPMWVNAEINASDAFIAAWLPGTEGAGIADVLLANPAGQIQYDFIGKLPFSWPATPTQLSNLGDKDYSPLFRYDYGLNYKNKQSNLAKLNEDRGPSHLEALPTRVLFNGVMQAPWTLFLISGEQSVPVLANTHELENLSYRTVDKVVQEDARRITIKGTLTAGVQIASKGHFREDLQSELDRQSALSFEYKLHQDDILKPVWVNMQCDSESSTSTSCTTKQKVTKQLQAKATRQWQTMTIDLQCFVDQGLALKDMIIPFQLVSEGPLDISLANIRFVPYSAKEATISCQP